MGKNFYVDFSGSILISVPNNATVEDVKIKFFEIINAYNYTHDPQLSYCEIDSIEEFKI